MTTKSPNVFTIIRRKLRKGRSYDLSAQAADEKEVVCLKGINDVPTSYDQPGVTNTLSPDGDTHSHVNHNGDSINVGPHLNGIHNNIAATIGSTPVSSPMRYCGNRNNRDETVDKSVHSCATHTKKVSCEDVHSQNQTLVKTWHSRTGSEAFAREVLPTTDTPRMTSLPVVAPPQMTVAKAAPVKEKVVVNSNCVCQKPQPLPEDDDVDIGGGYSVCKDVSRMQLRGDDVKQSTISPGENTSSTGTSEKDVPKSSACHLEDAACSRDDPIHLELVKIKQKIGTGSLNKDSHRPVNSDTFDICQAARSRQVCSSINSTGTVSVTSGDSENSTAESGEEADYTIVGDIEVQVPEDVAVAYQSPSRKSSKAGSGDTRPKVKTVSVKAVTEETERDVVNTSCDSSQPMASQQVLATSDSDDIFVNDNKRVYRKTTEHRLDCSSSSFSQLYASIPKGPVKSQGVSESSNLLEEEGPDDSSSGVVTSPDEPKEMGDETGEEECEDNIPPLPSRNYTIQEGEADVNYNVKMMRSISVTSASSTTSTDDEPTHMSWAEVMKEAQTLGIPLRTPSRELGEKLPNSQSTSSMDTSSSSIDTADGCTSPGGAKRPERRRDKMKLPSLVIKGGNVSISDVHAEVTTDMHRRTLPPPPRSPKSASPKVQTSTLGRPRFHSSGHLTSQEVRGSQSRNSLQSLDSGVGQSKSSVSLDTGMSKAKHGTSRESVPSTQGAAAVSEPASSSTNSTDIISSLSKLKDCGWYWGPLNWDDAEAKLADKVDGSFLVRDSSDDRYILSLTFRSQGTTHHTRIEHYKGMFSFYSQPKSHGESTIVEFIEKAMAHSRSGRFLYFLRPRAPGLPPAPIQLLFPVSRFQMVHSLQHVCRFAILKCVRRDHIMQLPVPLRLKEYLQQSQYYTENFSDDYSRYH